MTFKSAVRSRDTRPTPGPEPVEAEPVEAEPVETHWLGCRSSMVISTPFSWRRDAVYFWDTCLLFLALLSPGFFESLRDETGGSGAGTKHNNNNNNLFALATAS